MTHSSFGFHDNLASIEPAELKVSTLNQPDTQAIRLGDDVTIFMTAARLRELRDKITAHLETLASQPVVAVIEDDRPDEPDCDDGGVSDIEQQNNEAVSRIDPDEVYF